MACLEKHLHSGSTDSIRRLIVNKSLAFGPLSLRPRQLDKTTIFLTKPRDFQEEETGEGFLFGGMFQQKIHRSSDARNPAPVRFAIDLIILQGFIQLGWLFGISSEINKLSEIRMPYYSCSVFLVVALGSLSGQVFC